MAWRGKLFESRDLVCPRCTQYSTGAQENRIGVSCRGVEGAEQAGTGRGRREQRGRGVARRVHESCGALARCVEPFFRAGTRRAGRSLYLAIARATALHMFVCLLVYTLRRLRRARWLCSLLASNLHHRPPSPLAHAPHVLPRSQIPHSQSSFSTHARYPACAPTPPHPQLRLVHAPLTCAFTSHPRPILVLAAFILHRCPGYTTLLNRITILAIRCLHVHAALRDWPPPVGIADVRIALFALRSYASPAHILYQNHSAPPLTY
ncbi:hypothetical protein PENSPDRAFT_327808 [Peniophora sp. CONT]|nr:hypothetical protein PENSPDRAFT_327808 [Peniophora sp. CONT]